MLKFEHEGQGFIFISLVNHEKLHSVLAKFITAKFIENILKFSSNFTFFFKALLFACEEKN